MTDSRSAVATHELQQLERRRRLLERLIVIARSFKTRKKSLESLMHQGEAQSKPRPELVARLDALGRKVLNMSDAEVKLRLDNLDTKLNAQFRQVQPLLEQLEDDGTEQGTRLENAQASNQPLVQKRPRRRAPHRP